MRAFFHWVKKLEIRLLNILRLSLSQKVNLQFLGLNADVNQFKNKLLMVLTLRKSFNLRIFHYITLMILQILNIQLAQVKLEHHQLKTKILIKNMELKISTERRMASQMFLWERNLIKLWIK